MDLRRGGRVRKKVNGKMVKGWVEKKEKSVKDEWNMIKKKIKKIGRKRKKGREEEKRAGKIVNVRKKKRKWGRSWKDGEKRMEREYKDKKAICIVWENEKKGKWKMNEDSEKGEDSKTCRKWLIEKEKKRER